MRQVRVPFVFRGDSWTAAMPTFQMVPGTIRPLVPDKVHGDGVFPGVDPSDPALEGLTVEVLVPDGDATPDGQVDVEALRVRYPDHWTLREELHGAS